MGTTSRAVLRMVLNAVLALVLVAGCPATPVSGQTAGEPYTVVDTGQTTCYGTATTIACPDQGEPFFGQDSQFAGAQPNYTVSNDGFTVYDNTTGLTWQKSPDRDRDGDIDAVDKLAGTAVEAYPVTLNTEHFGGYSDWRIPTIKELYSLIKFDGIDPSGPLVTGTSGLQPFIDANAFDFGYGDTSAGERIIDAQFASSTKYVSTTMGGDPTRFGVNFADGRIKGYPEIAPNGYEKAFYVICVRGNTAYGVNDFVDNGDGTVTDNATGLMWAQRDSNVGMPWQDALAWVESQNAANYLGHNDWRLPNAKELQSIVDYTRSPSTTGSAAIDPLFSATSVVNEAGQKDFACYWTSTTHVNITSVPGANAAYVAFGRAMGYMNGAWLDVHGAGAQRSDPKIGDPADYPYGHGPQGDAIRIYNFVRLVRDTTDPPADENAMALSAATSPSIVLLSAAIVGLAFSRCCRQ